MISPRSLLLLSVLLALVVAACDSSTAGHDRERGAQTFGDCAEAFTDGFSQDSRSFHLHIDDVPAVEANTSDESLTLAVAEDAVRVAAERAGCDANELAFSAQLSNCTHVTPEDALSRVCYLSEPSVGYFFITEALPEQIAVTFSRFD